MSELVKAMHELDEAKVLTIMDQRIAASDPPLDILADLQEGMRLIGKDFEAGNYFLSELIMSATVFKMASEKLNTVLTQDAADAEFGTFVIGTVKDDIHDIGKDIVATLLACQGFNVVDLGVDVPAEKFVEAIKAHKPKVVGLSCLLTTAFESMKNTVDAIEQAGLRNGLPVIIGGAHHHRNGLPVRGRGCLLSERQRRCGHGQENGRGCGMSKEELLKSRWERINKAINLEKPDHTPVILLYTLFSANITGMPFPEFCKSIANSAKAMIAAFEMCGDADGVDYLGFTPHGLSELWLSKVKVPGVQLPDDVVYQVAEAELMKVEDYDAILKDGWPKWVG